MASRVASSLLAAAGLGGLLVARTSKDFENIAVTLAVRVRTRQQMRRRMKEKRCAAILEFCNCLTVRVVIPQQMHWKVEKKRYVAMLVSCKCLLRIPERTF